MKPFDQRIGLLIAMLSAFLSASAYDFEVDGIYYNIVSFSNLTCEVTYGESKYTGDIVIPSIVTYNSREIKVTTIDVDAFRGCSALTSVSIPNSVTAIGSHAFYDCRSLISVTIPNSVSTIGSQAFYNCSSLTSITIPNSVTKINGSVFQNCSSLTSVSIANSVTIIGPRAFKGCSSLTSVSLPNSVTTIDEEAFHGCSALTSVLIPNSVTTINAAVFEFCRSLTSVSIPTSVTKISIGTFYGCSSLTSVIIPNSVTSIDSQAFSNCSSLRSTKLGTGLEYLGIGVFENCNALKSLTLPGSLSSWFITSFPKGIIELTFEYDDKVKNPDIPTSVEKLYTDRNFDIYPELTSLKEYIIGEHVSKSNLKINNCPNLESVTCYAAKPPTLFCNPTNAQYMNLNVFVPDESLNLYKISDIWKNFWNLQGINASAIDDITPDDEIREVCRYDIYGRPVDMGYKGLTIIRYSDGSTRKIVH